METTITSSSLDCGEATFAKGRTVPDCQRMQFLPKLFGERLMLAFGLPAGSVKLVGPRRSSKLEDGSTIGDLRQVWASK